MQEGSHIIVGLTHDEHGRPRQSLSVSIKVAIGLGPDEKQGRKAPQKLDYFVFLTKQGSDLKWAPNKELTEHYRKQGGNTPRQVPIILMADDPEDVFRTQYAWWTSKERRCWSGVKKQDGNYVQIATRRTEKNPDGQLWSPPNPCGPGCPDLERGDCKPSGDLYFVLSDFPTLGSVCRLHTSGYRSIRQIYSSLEQLRNTFGGRLSGLRVMLRVRPERTAYIGADQKKHTTTVYALSLELSANDMKGLLEKAAENAKLFRETRLLLGGRVPEIVYKDEAEEAEEIAAEFYPVEEKPQGRIVREEVPKEVQDKLRGNGGGEAKLSASDPAPVQPRDPGEDEPPEITDNDLPAEWSGDAPAEKEPEAGKQDTIWVKFHGKAGSMMATLWGRTDLIADELRKQWGGKENKAEKLWIVPGGWVPYITEHCESQKIRVVEKD